MSQNQTLDQKVVDLCGHTAEALEKAAAVVERDDQAQVKMAELAPKVAQVLADNGRIYPSQIKAATQQLMNPVRCLEILEKVASHRNENELSRLGEGVPADGAEKTASHNPQNSLTNPHVGARTTMVKQSDVVLHQRLGLAPPAQG